MAEARTRILVAALSLSAAAFVGRAVQESYSTDAVIPVKGDVPTLGFGMTHRPDGSPVQMGDTTNPVEALQRSLAHVQKDEAGIKRCITAPLHQAEYDLLVDFSYQYGVPTLCKSSIAARTNARNYAGACEAYLMYRFAGGFDCSTPGNKRCGGVWKDAQRRHRLCVAAQP
jgi:lysozyme